MLPNSLKSYRFNSCSDSGTARTKTSHRTLTKSPSISTSRWTRCTSGDIWPSFAIRLIDFCRDSSTNACGTLPDMLSVILQTYINRACLILIIIKSSALRYPYGMTVTCYRYIAMMKTCQHYTNEEENIFDKIPVNEPSRSRLRTTKFHVSGFQMLPNIATVAALISPALWSANTRE